MLIIGIRKGGGKCSSSCPWYTETGKVKGVCGVPLQTNCRMVMHPWMIDCDVYDPHEVDKLEVSEEQWKQMQHAVHKRAIRQRKLYPEDHAPSNEVGCEWTRNPNRKGKWNAEKSKSKN